MTLDELGTGADSDQERSTQALPLSEESLTRPRAS